MSVFTNTFQTLPDIRSGAVMNFTRPNNILQDRKKTEQFEWLNIRIYQYLCSSNYMLVLNIAVLQPLLWPLGQYAYAAQVIDLFSILNWSHGPPFFHDSYKGISLLDSYSLHFCFYWFVSSTWDSWRVGFRPGLALSKYLNWLIMTKARL